MVSGLAGISVALGTAASTGAFVRGAGRRNKRPTIGSLLVALVGVPSVAASLSGLTAGPLALLGRIPGLSIVAWLVATAVLVVLCAIGGHLLAHVMGKPKGPQAGDVLRGAQLATADRWEKRTERMRARNAGVV